MTWLVWRQHRTEVLTLALLVAVIGLALLALGLPMHSLFPGGAARCAGIQADLAGSCSAAVSRLWDEHGYAAKMLSLFNLVPFLIGAFLGAPLLARELEHGTWQLAWTQAVPRMRWLAVKLVALAAVAVALSAALAAVVTWYRQPFDVLDGRFTTDAFDLEGIAPAGYALFAFAAATAAGTILRRSLPALAVALAVFVAVRFAVGGWLRPHYQAPRTLTETVAAKDPAVDVGNPHMSTGSHLDWTIAAGYADSTGRRLSIAEVYGMSVTARESGTDLSTHLNAQGVRQWVTFQPAGRFWTFQLVETSIFVALAAALLALAAWWVKRRVSR